MVFCCAILIDLNLDESKIKIICKEHGEYLQTPNTHLRGGGCKKCSIQLLADRNRKHTTETIVEKAKQLHGDKYNYSKAEYTGIDNKIIIIC